MKRLEDARLLAVLPACPECGSRRGERCTKRGLKFRYYAPNWVHDGRVR